jgi:hypothetical protein
MSILITTWENKDLSPFENRVLRRSACKREEVVGG